MPGRRVEERLKSNEATKGTRGSQRPSKGRAQGRGHRRHTASTTPHRDTGEGSTRGTREERHHAPRHARHRHHTHRTHPTSPSSPPSGRAVGGGTAPDLRPPSQWWKAPPPGTAPHHPRGTQPPEGMQAKGDSVGPPHPHTRARSTWVADPNSPPSGRAVGGGTAPDPRRPSQYWKAPPPGTPFHHPHSEQRRPARAHPVGAGAGSPRPHRPHPGHTGRGTLAARSRGRAAGGGTAPDTRRPLQRWQATPPGDGPPPPPRHAAPTGHAGRGHGVGLPQPHTRAHSTWVADPNSPPSGRAFGGGTARGLRRPP